MLQKVKQLVIVDLMGLESQVVALDGGALEVGLAKTKEFLDD